MYCNVSVSNRFAYLYREKNLLAHLLVALDIGATCVLLLIRVFPTCSPIGCALQYRNQGPVSIYRQSFQVWGSHYKDKMVMGLSYLYIGALIRQCLFIEMTPHPSPPPWSNLYLPSFPQNQCKITFCGYSLVADHQRPVSISDKMSYHKISWSLEAGRLHGSSNYRIALKFDRHFGSPAAEVPVKFQSDWTIINTNLAASRLRDLTVRHLIGYWNGALIVMIFTWGQFWPSGIVVASFCLPLCMSVCVCQHRACLHDNLSPV